MYRGFLDTVQQAFLSKFNNLVLDLDQWRLENRVMARFARDKGQVVAEVVLGRA